MAGKQVKVHWYLLFLVQPYMMKKYLQCFACLVLLSETHFSTVNGLVDKKATRQTRNLFYRLRTNAFRGRSLVGADSSTRFGEFMRKRTCGALNHQAPNGKMTDIRDVCKKNPGIYGIDAAYIVGDFFSSHDHNPTEQIRRSRNSVRKSMIAMFRRGGVITIHYHMDNPIDGSGYNGGTKELWRIIPPKACSFNQHLWGLQGCGSAHSVYKRKLSTLVWFLKSVVADGHTVPVIYRPFHENNGEWFWWGFQGRNRSAYQSSLRIIWDWTVNFVNRVENHHSVLWAYSPNGGANGGLTPKRYFAFAPKKAHIDVLGYDRYGDFGGRASDGIREIRMVVKLARRLGKIPAVTEVGHNNHGMRSMWPANVWTKHTLGVIKNDAVATKVAWMLMWMNYPYEHSCEGKYYGPHGNHANAADFKRICNRKDIILEGRVNYYG